MKQYYGYVQHQETPTKARKYRYCRGHLRGYGMCWQIFVDNNNNNDDNNNVHDKN